MASPTKGCVGQTLDVLVPKLDGSRKSAIMCIAIGAIIAGLGILSFIFPNIAFHSSVPAGDMFLTNMALCGVGGLAMFGPCIMVKISSCCYAKKPKASHKGLNK